MDVVRMVLVVLVEQILVVEVVVELFLFKLKIKK